MQTITQYLLTPQRIIQIFLSILLFIAVGLYWHFNEIGQNLINITAALMLVIGLDNIIIYYRCYKQSTKFEHEGTFIIFCLFMLGIIFQNFNKSYGSNLWLNQISKYSIIAVLAVNFSYYIAVLVILALYLVRQIYRLMTETLLSANTSIEPQNLNLFLDNNRKPYSQLHAKYPSLNNSCSICLFQFQAQNQCIVLPSCRHCFHVDCITQWLQNKSTCPYCRHNIQLDLDIQNQE